jgi:hypothetical protein
METKDSIRKIFCGVSVIVSVLLSVALLSGGKIDTKPFSALGLENQVLFFFWGIFTGAATFFNLTWLASRLGYQNRLFKVLLTVGCLIVLVTVTVMGYEPVNRIIHVGSAMVFGVTTVSCVLWILIVKLIRQDKKTTVPYLCALVLAGIVFIVTFIQTGWFTAFTQVLLADVCLAIMFCSNFLEKWSFNKAKATVELESRNAG